MVLKREMSYRWNSDMEITWVFFAFDFHPVSTPYL